MYHREFENYTLAVAGCGQSVRIYEGVKHLTQIPKDDSHMYLTQNDIDLAKEVYAGIKRVEKRRLIKHLDNMLNEIRSEQIAA